MLKIGSYRSAFAVASVVLVIGIVFYVLVFGRIESVPDFVLEQRNDGVLHRSCTVHQSASGGKRD